MISAVSCVVLALAQSPSTSIPPSRITAVTVYPDRAEVTRETALRAVPGTQELLIGPLPVEMDDGSLRVSGSGTGGGITLGGIEVRYVPGVEIRGSELEAAEAELAGLQEIATALDDRLARITKLRELLGTLQTASASQFAKEMASTELKPQSWQGAYEFLKKNLDELSTEERQTNRERAALADRVDVASRTVAMLKGRRTLAHKIVAVSVQSEADSDISLRLSYAQPGASWAPAYEAVMDPDAGEVTLGKYAWVKQTTGERWNDVRLTLATGAPSLGIDLPKLSALVLSFGMTDRDGDGNPNVRGARDTALQHRLDGGSIIDPVTRTFGQNLNADFIDELEVITSGASVESGRADGGFVNIVQKLALHAQADTVMTFQVPGTVSLNPDGQARRMAITRSRLAGRREYLIVPSVKPAAFLLARVTAPPDHPLLAGMVKHYVGSTLVGSSNMPLVAPGEEFVLSFGSDDRVKVDRSTLPRMTSTKGSTRVTTCDRRVAITNRTGGSIDIEVKDRVPIPTSAEIRVSVGGTTTEGFGLEEDEPGIYTWKLALAPGEKKEISLSYSVRYPSHMTLATLR